LPLSQYFGMPADSSHILPDQKIICQSAEEAFEFHSDLYTCFQNHIQFKSSRILGMICISDMQLCTLWHFL